MTNRAGISMTNDGPPQKRRRTLQPHSTTLASSNNAAGEKKLVRKKETDQRKEPFHQTPRAIKTTVDRRCTDYLSDEWHPDFRSTYPLAKALERRRVLVDYIHLVKRVNARKDRVEMVQKRPSVHQPQTIEDLEKEIEKCNQEMDSISRKRDENIHVKKDLMSRYKSLYKEEDEERKRLKQDEEKKIAEVAQMNEYEKLLYGMFAAQNGAELMQNLIATQITNPNANNSSSTPANSLIQNIQQGLMSGNSAFELSQYINAINLHAQQQQASAAKNTPSSANVSQQKHASPAVTTPNRMQTSIGQPQSNLLNSASSLNVFQNPFNLSSQPSGLLTQQSQGGLITTTQSSNLQNTNSQHQTPNRASPNVQQNPFLAASSSTQQGRTQNAFPTAQSANAQQLDFQNLFNQWSATQGLQNLASMIPGGINNPQAAALLLQQPQLGNNYLLSAAGLMNPGVSRQSLAPFANQNQMGRKPSVASSSLTNQQMQNRLQMSTNLAGRSATPQLFAVPNLPASSSNQSKIPPRAQSTRPPVNLGTTITSNNPGANPSVTQTMAALQSGLMSEEQQKQLILQMMLMNQQPK